jgi:hypothetical protein
MVEAVIIPTLLLELFEETVHGASLVQKPYHPLVTDPTFYLQRLGFIFDTAPCQLA